MRFNNNQDTTTSNRDSNPNIAVDITHTPPTPRFDSNSNAANIVNTWLLRSRASRGGAWNEPDALASATSDSESRLYMSTARRCQSARVSFILNSQHASGPSIPSFPHAITPPPVLPQITILAARTISSRGSTSQGSSPNMSALSIVASIAAVIAMLVILILPVFCCKCCLPRRSTTASSADLKVDPVPNEAGDPKVINTHWQPEPSNEGIKEPPHEGALSLSTTTDLPTTPMRVYVRSFVPSFRSRLFILFLGLLGSKQCIQVARAPRRSAYEGRLFPGNFWRVQGLPKHPHAGQHASLVTLAATKT